MSEFKWTEKGTLFSENYNDVYFNDGHGVEETDYVFLQGNNIRQRFEESKTVIGELGFGTGLNFLVTWDAWRRHKKKSGNRLIFVTCEKHPLNKEPLEKAHVKFPQFARLSQQLRDKLPLIKSGFHFLEFEESRVALLLMYGDVLDVFRQLESKVDAWYLDGFAPKNNPQMWNEQVYKQIAWHSHKNTTLATYTAVGDVRRGLQAVGFEVERIKGYAKKRHMTKAVYKGYVKENLHLQPWYRHKAAVKPRTAAVIGAGMAGLNTAYALQRLGVDVTIYEKAAAIAPGASGNRFGMVLPLVAKKPDRLGSLTKAGAHFSINQFDDLGIPYKRGLLEFATDEGRLARFSEAIQRLDENYVRLLNPAQLKEEFDVESSIPALYHSGAVSLSPRRYAEVLLNESGAALELNCQIESLSKNEAGWQLTTDDARQYQHDCVIICSAAESVDLAQTAHLPIHKTRGQVVYLNEEQLSHEPQLGLNFVNYLVQSDDGNYVLGATFQPGDSEEELRPADSAQLLESAVKYFPDLLKKDIDASALDGRVSFRAMQKDHFSILGSAPDYDACMRQYSDLKYGKPVSRYEDAICQEGLYVNCGHGSRGLTLSPLLSAALARHIVDDFYIMPVSHVTAVSPVRFIVKKLKKHQ